VVLLGLLVSSTPRPVNAADIVATHSMSIPPSGRTAGRWSNGAFLVVRNERSPTPSFEAYDRIGAKIDNIRLEIPGAQLIIVHSGSFARSANGAWAIAGTAYDGEDRGAAFIALRSSLDHQTLIRTAPFIPYQIAVSNDGTVWAAGYELPAGKESPQYFIIRRYGSDGHLIGASVPRSGIGDTTIPAMRSFFAVSADRIVWYSDSAHLVLEFAVDGSETGRYRIAPMEFRGICVCDDNTVWMGMSHVVGNDKRVELAIIERPHGELRTVAELVKPVGFLYGCDGTKLVWHEATQPRLQIAWLERISR